MQELELTWERSLRVWAVFFMLHWAGAAAWGFFIGFLFNVNTAEWGAAGIVVQLVVTAVFWMVFIRIILLKNYKDFRIALLPKA